MTKFKASDFEKGLEKTYKENVKPEETKCSSCGKIDYNEAIEFDDGQSFCKECCDKAGMSGETKAEALPSWAEEIFNSSGYYLDDKERVRLDIDQKELEKIIRQTIKTKRAEAYQEGFIAGADATGSQMNEFKIEELKKAQEQAVKEEAKKWKTVCMYACDAETWEQIRNGLHALNKPKI